MSKSQEPPTFLPYSPGNAGGECGRLPHWSQMLQCSDGRHVFGYGATEESCRADALSKQAIAEMEIAAPPTKQIEIILERCQNRIYDEDIQRLLKLLAKVVLECAKNQGCK